MKYGELGRSGMNISKICLGTMHFGPKATEMSTAQRVASDLLDD